MNAQAKSTRNCCVLLLFLIITVCASGVAQADQPVRYRVAVLYFSVNDITGTITNTEAIGRAMADELQTPLVESRRFVVITREELERVLEELGIGDTGLVNPEQVQEFGRLDAADVIITGNINVFSETAYSISARFIEVATGEVGTAVTITATGPQEFQDVAHRLVERALERFPLEGSVIAIEGGEVFIDVGVSRGLTPQDTSGVIYRSREIAGRSFPERIGSFNIVQIGPDISLISPKLDEGFDLKEGDIVSIVPVLVSPVAEPGATEVGILSIRGEPDGAEVVVDGEPAGTLTEGLFSQSVAAGVSRLRIEADGHVPAEHEVEVLPNRVTNLEVELEPLRGSATFQTAPAPARVYLDGELRGESPLTVPELVAGEYHYRVEADGHAPEEGTVVVGGDEVVLVEVELIAEPGLLVLELAPQRAEVLLDGQPATSPLELAAGVYQVTVRAEGYRESDFTITLAAGETVERTVALEPLEAVLELAIDAPEADEEFEFEVLVDGQSHGAARTIELPPGEYEVTVRAPDKVPEVFAIILSAGERHTATVSLEERPTLLLYAPIGTNVLATPAGGRPQWLASVASEPQAYALEPGQYRLLLSGMPEVMRQTIEIDVPADDTLEVHARGLLTVEFTETRVPVSIFRLSDDVKVFEGDSAAALELEPGDYLVRSGDEEEEVTLAAGEAKTITLVGLVDPVSGQARDGTVGTLRLVFNAAGASVTLEGSVTRQLDVPAKEAEVRLASGLYMVRAQVPGASPVDDVVYVPRAGLATLDIEFDLPRANVSAGTLNTGSHVHPLFFVEHNGAEAAWIDITGPFGRNGDSTLRLDVDPERAVYWSERVTAWTGDYVGEINYSAGRVEQVELSIDLGQRLEPPHQLRAWHADEALQVSWRGVASAASYHFAIWSDEWQFDMHTDTTGVILDDRSLQPGTTYTVCVTAFDWEISPPAAADGQPNASRSCADYRHHAPDDAGPQPPLEPRQDQSAEPPTPPPVPP